MSEHDLRRYCYGCGSPHCACTCGVEEEEAYDAWFEDEYGDERDELVLFCGTPDCLFQGEHYRSECFTAEDCEEQYFEALWQEHPEVGAAVSRAWRDQDEAVAWARSSVLGFISSEFARLKREDGYELCACGEWRR